ncbi:hypothetical protein JTB14_004044 [Gonioctena quinquepunctata]|nr:hypothetical protein JTB14_004044 [Gonioctena quinquepunctata]
MQSWVVPTLTTSIIFVVLFFLFCCLCWERKKKIPQFYILEESGLKEGSQDFFRNSLNNLKLFRRFSASKEPEEVFTSKNLPIINGMKETKPELDLIDSMDEKKSFDTLVLQFDETERPTTPREELRSCISTDSLNTFYSANHSLVRTNSRSSFVSIISDSDEETFIS